MIRFSTLFLCGLCVVSAAVPGIADSNVTAVTLTREHAVAMALKHNRDLLIARQVIRRAEIQFTWAGRLDNPSVELNYRDDSFGLDDGEDSLELAFEQALPLTSRLRREQDLRQAQLVLAKAEVAERKRELAHDVDLAVTRLAAARQRRGDQQEIFELSQSMSRFLEKQVVRGEASALDVTQAVLATGLLAQEIKAVEAEEAQLLGRLQFLLGVTSNVPVELDVSMDLPTDLPQHDLDLEAVMKRRPDFVIALSEIESSEVRAGVEEARQWQDVVLRVFAEWEQSVDEPEGLDRNTLAGLGVSFPLPLIQRNQGGMADAAQETQDARLALEALRHRIENELALALKRCEDTHAIALALNGTLMELARKQLSEVQRAYEDGQTGLIVVQRAQEQLLQSQTAALAANAAYHEAEAQWRYAAALYEIETKTEGETQ